LRQQNIKKEAHEQSSKLCLKMSLLPDCTTMLILYSTRTIHKTREQKTTSEMNPSHHLHITETPTLTAVKMMTMSPLTNNQCMVFFKDSTGTFLELIHSGTHCITRQTDQESEEKHTTH
jgi:hypothetical protein